jgi:hypothetical protein
MHFFLENPWRILIIGAVLEAVLAFLLFQTGRGKILWVMILVGAVVVGCVTVERMVVTDRESIATTLDAAITAVKAGDEAWLLRCIAPSAKSPREDACWVLRSVDVEESHVIGLEVAVNRSVSPPTAEAKFMAVGVASLKNGPIQHEGYARHVTVWFQCIDGHWLVQDYKIEGLNGPLRKVSLK